MSQPEMPSDGLRAGPHPDSGAEDEPRGADYRTPGAPAAPWAELRFPRGQLSVGERDRMLGDTRDVSFRVAVRGYNRAEVDRYVKGVNMLIAQLEISSAPESAVKHALDEVSEEASEILHRAHQSAQELAARSRVSADDRLRQAEQDAREIRESAEREAEESHETATKEAHALREAATQEAQKLRETGLGEVDAMRDAATRKVSEIRATTLRETRQLRAGTERDAEELQASARREADEVLEEAQRRARELTESAERMWRERRRLIEDITALGAQLLAIGEAEGERFQSLGRDVTGSDEPGD
jgi:DivIVA domain-containing protein